MRKKGMRKRATRKKGMRKRGRRMKVMRKKVNKKRVKKERVMRRRMMEKELLPQYSHHYHTELLPLRIGLALVGKMLATSLMSVLGCFTSEIFPTVARGSGLFLCILFSNLANILAPQFNLLVSESVRN